MRDPTGGNQGEWPQTWYSTNLVGLPVACLASTEFNQAPVPLHIGGTRNAHAGLFSLLQRCDSSSEASDVFVHYMALAFSLQPDPGARTPGEARRWRSSYTKLIQGWGLNSSGPAGAVLKGWVESRFGLVPRFHKAPLSRFPSPAWVDYLEEKVSSRYHNNCIDLQLDVLYEFAQWTLERFQPFGTALHLVCWRGIGLDEVISTGGRAGAASGRCVLRLNNVVSLSTGAHLAECFGDRLYQVRVPMPKVLYYPGLIPGMPLAG